MLINLVNTSVGGGAVAVAARDRAVDRSEIERRSVAAEIERLEVGFLFPPIRSSRDIVPRMFRLKGV